MAALSASLRAKGDPGSGMTSTVSSRDMRQAVEHAHLQPALARVASEELAEKDGAPKLGAGPLPGHSRCLQEGEWED